MAGKRAARHDDPRAGAAATVVLPVDCRLASLAAVQAALIEAGATGAIELDGRAVERVDTAALQLLTILRRELDKAGATLTWSGASAALNDAASLLGLAKLLALPAVGPA
jgi:ABC-type transporter Mla MlaB component